ncbi:MAG: hypothetical protein IPM29_09110 [Planctomycetes bacterium]|nr:hypothetical protein [Planctomycetota bacterium]
MTDGEQHGPAERDAILIARFVDGESSPAERAAVERRLAAEPALREEVAALRALRELFAADRAAPAPIPRGGPEAFRHRVLARVAAASVGAGAAVSAVDAAAVDAAASGATGGRDAALVRWCRRVVWVAAAVVVLGFLLLGGVLRAPDARRVEASGPEIERAMQELDARWQSSRWPAADGSATGAAETVDPAVAGEHEGR